MENGIVLRKSNILDFDKLKREYSFIESLDSETDLYFCNCGQIFPHETQQEVGEESMETIKNNFDNEMLSTLLDIKLSLEDEIICPTCSKSFKNQTERRKLFTIGTPFIEGFGLVEDDNFLTICFSEAYSSLVITDKFKNKQDDFSNLREKFILGINENVKYIKIDKVKKEAYFKDLLSETEQKLDLDNLIKCLNIFFESNVGKIINLHNIHIFISKLAEFVNDSNNIEVINEFMSFLRNNPLQAGFEHIKKLMAVFISIMVYGNLSTIAMTKGGNFLYDLMIECDIPSSSVMKEKNATSPLKIFNFLVQNYITKLNAEVNEDNKESFSFSYKSTKMIEQETGNVIENTEGKTLNINIKNTENYKEGKVAQTEGGFKVLDAIDDGTVSNFIFKKINNFSQYKKVIKYFKFYDKHELINIMNKYDIDFLTNVIDFIYFRKKMELKELFRVFDIILDFLNTKFFVFDYSNIRSFSFIEYDDTLLMMELLKFDPKKHFNKIRTVDELTKYHDELVSYYAVVTSESEQDSIKIFTSKFLYLEDKANYNGPLELKILDSAELIIKEGIEMYHSAAAYASNVARGNYLLASIYDRSNDRPDNEHERFTIGFIYDEINGIEFDQVKSYGNDLGSDRFKKLVMDFLVNKDISFRPIKDLKLESEL